MAPFPFFPFPSPLLSLGSRFEHDSKHLLLLTMQIIEIPICADTTVRVPFSYACLCEIRPSVSKDLPMMQIVSILILHPRSPAPTTISLLLLCSQLFRCCCVLHRQIVVCSLHTLIVPKHNLKSSHFKSGLAVIRLDATKKMISNPHPVVGGLSTSLHMQNNSPDPVMTCICMQIYYLFHDSSSRNTQALQHWGARGRPAISTQGL